MEIKCTCPHCGEEFTVNVDEPKKPRQKRNVSEAARAAASERMRQMRLNGVGGRPKGIKETKHRSTYGKARRFKGGEIRQED